MKVVQVLGTSTQYKSLTLTHEDYPFGLQFIDLLLYLAGGTLEKNAKAFSKDVVKGVFPYEVSMEDNYHDVLSLSEPFTHEQFYSSLNNSNISDKEYAQYLADVPNFPTRLEYLLHYNEPDTKIMLPIINTLISKFAEYGVDMLKNLSLSSNASQVKYANAYDGFSISANYSKQVKTTYTLTTQVW
jgi:hypothetical protein